MMYGSKLLIKLLSGLMFCLIGRHFGLNLSGKISLKN